MTDNFFIIDCNAFCYWCLPHNDTDEGDMTKAVIFNFLMKLRSWCTPKDEKNHFIFCWDSKLRHREEIYPEYKANRNGKELLVNGADYMPHLQLQMVLLRKKILPSLGFINVFHQEGFEADDLVAYCTRKLWLKGNVFIISRDHDLYQLFEFDDVQFLWNKEIFDVVKFKKLYGIAPEYFTLMKAIAGDTGDNIKGITGVGKKKAVDYLLERLPEHHKAYKAIEDGQDIINRNLKLVTIPFQTEKYKLENFNINLDEKLYQKDFMDTFDKLYFTGLLTSGEFKIWTDRFRLQ